MSQPKRSFLQHPGLIAFALIFGLLTGAITVLVFVTDKNLPELLGASTQRASPSVGPVSTPTTESTSAPPTTTTPTTASADNGPPSTTPRPAPATASSQSEQKATAAVSVAVQPPASVVSSLAAPPAANIEACVEGMFGGTGHLSDYGLAESDLGRVASLHITVAGADDAYTLYVEDANCHPAAIRTFSPGQGATFTLYYGAVWDFVRHDGSSFTGAPGPISPQQPGPYLFENHSTQITVE